MAKMELDVAELVEETFRKHFGVTLDRLRELAEADKDGQCSAGCEYCRERKPILDDIGQLQIDDSDSTLWYIAQVAADDIYEDHTEIRYCPMCGRKLTPEAAEAALEAHHA